MLQKVSALAQLLILCGGGSNSYCYTVSSSSTPARQLLHLLHCLNHGTAAVMIKHAICLFAAISQSFFFLNFLVDVIHIAGLLLLYQQFT
jgi:hypothetical protein